MADDFLKYRTFKLYYFDPKPLPDFAAESQCGGKHHNGGKVAFDFRAVELHDDVLRPTVLKFKDQSFETVATDWERKHSAILNAGGWMPVVDDEGVVVAYLGQNDPIATYMRPLLDVDGNLIQELWDEPALQPSLPFELLGTLYGGLAGRAIVKGAIRKFAAKGVIKVKGAIKGAMLKTILRKRIVPKRLPDVAESFDYGPFSGSVPNFHAKVSTHGDDVLYQISYQVTKDCGTAAQRLTAAQLRTKAIRFAAEQAKLRGQSTFRMQIDQANPASREAAERLLLKAGKPHAPKTIPSGGTYPRLEWVLETEKVLANVN